MKDEASKIEFFESKYAFIIENLAGCPVVNKAGMVKAMVPTEKFDALVEAIEAVETPGVYNISMSMKSLNGDSMIMFNVNDDVDSAILANSAS